MIDSYFLDTMDKTKSKLTEEFQIEEFHCPVEATLSLIGGKYKTLISELLMRFGLKSQFIF